MSSKNLYLCIGLLSVLCLGMLFATQTPLDRLRIPESQQKTASLSLVPTAEDPAISSTVGKQSYQRVCAKCHNRNGLGMPGIFPPIKGAEWTQNDLVIANIILRGLSGTIEVSGQRYASSMGSMASEVTDQEVASIIRYIQEGFNNKRSTITVEQVTHIRQQQLRRISSQSGLQALQDQYSSLSSQ